MRTAVALAILFFLDVGVSGQGFLSILVAVIGTAVLVVRALAAVGRGSRPLARTRAIKACMYVMLGAATVVMLRVNVATAQANALRIIDACRAYQGKHGALPDRLDQLVPEFLPAVPRAKYTLSWNQFSYWGSSDDSRTLMYVAVPPFGRQVYHFKDRRWSQID